MKCRADYVKDLARIVPFMDERAVEERVEEMVLPILKEADLELVGVEFRPRGRRWLLRVFIDREGGVRLSDCEWVSRELERFLDVEDLIDHPYVLEVSSPGLTRELKRIEEFERFKGRKVKIVTVRSIERRNDFLGLIKGREGDSVIIREGEKEIVIPFSYIKKARLEFEL